MKTRFCFAVCTALLLAASAVAQTPWYLTGNSGTSSSTNFLGTTDNKPLVLRTNNVERMRITAAGKIGFGTTAPTTTFDLIGTFKAGGATGYCKIDSTGNFFFTGDGALRIQANKYCFKLAVGSKGGMYYDKDNKRFEFRDTFATRTFSVNFDGEGFLKGGLQLGNSSSTTAGTIRWTGTDFEGRTASGWVSLTAGGGGGGANTSLSNLTTTSINQNLLPSANNTRNLGSSSLGWKDLYLAGSIFSGSNRIFSIAGTENLFVGTQAGQANTTGFQNMAAGYQALYANTTGYANTAAGVYALYANTTGYSNTAAGIYALYANTTGYANTAAGVFALYANTTGTSNTVVGSYALSSNTTGNYNTAAGSYALYSNTTRSNLVAVGDSALFNNGIGATSSFHATANSAFGSKALYANTTGYSNTATGYQVLYSNTTGYSNTATGYQVLYSNTTGHWNTAAGYRALYSNTAGLYNTATGYQALYSNTTGKDNTAAGTSALYYNTTGTWNTAAGNYALFSNTTGYDNTAASAYALYSNTTGFSNTAVGFDAGSFNNANNHCSFFGYNADQSVSTDFSNSTALGNTSRITASNQVRIGNSSVTSIGGFANWSNVSDARYKKEVKENVPGLEFISKLRPVTYHLDVAGLARFFGEGEFRPTVEGREEAEPDATTLELDRKARAEKEKILYTGFIAQEVEKAAQEVGFDFSGVDKPQNEHSLYGLRYAEFVVPLVKAVQELNEENQKLKAENTELKTRIEKIESLLSLSRKEERKIPAAHESVTLSGSARLEQNVPNPFDGSTVIGYFVPDASARVQLQFTSATGEVLSTVDLAAGKGTVTVKAQDLPSGAYRYSLLVDGKVADSKTMVKQK